MTLQAAVSAELPFLRAEAKARMLDSFDIKTSNGMNYDAGQGKDIETFTLLFSTKGRVKSGALAVREDEVGARTSASVARELHIPVDSDAIPAGAFAFCTAVDVTSDPTLVGARLRIEGPAPGSQTTARRLQVTEVLS